MALQQCRAALPRTRNAFRVLSRSYATDLEQQPLSSSNSPASSSSASSSPVPSSHAAEQTQHRPRWSYTPEAMKAPIQMDWAKDARNKIWPVNNDPAKLDDFYNRLLGPGGSRMLPEEIKWLAVTHKSFDQGRRGFNDRLALMGRMVLQLEGAKHMLSKPPLEGARRADDWNRTPFEHEQLASVDNLTVKTPQAVFNREALYDLGKKLRILDVLRWKPRLPEDLVKSGVETVVPSTLMAVIGAINMQHGSEVASQAVRERILTHMRS